MVYGEPANWPPLILLGATLASAGITFFLYRLRYHALPAAVVGAVLPGAAIFAICFYLDAQLPEGVYYLWFGMTLGPAAAFFGLFAAAITAILCVRLSGDTPNSS
jgi:hypothetical protein